MASVIYFFLLNLIIVVRKKLFNPTQPNHVGYMGRVVLGWTYMMRWVGLNFFWPTMMGWVKKSPQSNSCTSLVSPERIIIEKSLKLDFLAMNNKAEFKALLEGMDMVQKMRGRAMEMFSDLMLVVG